MDPWFSSVWSLFLTDHPYPQAWCLQVGKEIAGKQMPKFGKSSATSPLLCSTQVRSKHPNPSRCPLTPVEVSAGTWMQVQSSWGSPGTELQQSPGWDEEGDREGRGGIVAVCREQALPQECRTWLCHSTRSPSGSWDCGESWLCVCMLSRVARKWGKPHEGWKGERKDRELFFHECFIPQCIPSSGAFAHDASVVQHNLHRHGSVPCPGHSPGKKQPVNNLEAGSVLISYHFWLCHRGALACNVPAPRHCHPPQHLLSQSC